MQVLWFVPSLVFGTVMAIATGSWLMLAFASSTLLILPFLSWQRRRKAVDLGADIEIFEDEIYIGNYRLPRSGMLWRQEWHDVLFQKISADLAARVLQRSLTFDRPKTQLREADFILGRSETGWVEISLRDEFAHLLVVGATGTGKSQLLISMLNSHFSIEGQSVADFWLIDFKGGATLRKFAENSHVRKFATDLSESMSIWSELMLELVARERFFADHGVSRLEDFQASDNPPNRLFIVMDELAAAITGGSQALGAVSAVLSRGRSLGVHLIAASQSSQGIPRSALINFGARVFVGSVDQIEAAQLGIRAQKQLTAESALSASLHLRDKPTINFVFANPSIQQVPPVTNK